MTTDLTPLAPRVTLLTALAATTELSDAEYRAIYNQVAATAGTLRNIKTALASTVSHTWWSMYAHGDKQLDRARKNELRAWAGLPELALTPGEAVAAHVHPDAAVYYIGAIGASSASRVILIGQDVRRVAFEVTGDCRLMSAVSDSGAGSVDASVTTNTASTFDLTHVSHLRCRPRYFRPCLSLDMSVRISQLEALLAAARRAV